jgi:hypothetical protein
VPVREDGTFELTRLHGPAMIAVDRLPAGWIVKSVRHGITDITDVPMDFARSGEPRPVEVRVTNRVARLTPIILDENGKPTMAAMVVLVPADPARWKGGVVALWERIVAMPSRNAEARPSMCRPGEYIIAAVSPEDLRDGLQSMDAIKTLAERGQRITLKEDADYRPEVRIVKLTRGRRP